MTSTMPVLDLNADCIISSRCTHCTNWNLMIVRCMVLSKSGRVGGMIRQAQQEYKSRLENIYNLLYKIDI